MVITCGDCGARFRLDVALLKGAKGIRVRCRRCGGKIVVLRPEAPSDLPADDGIPIHEAGPPAVPTGERPPVPQKGRAAGADISGVLRPEPFFPERPGPVPPRVEDSIDSPAMDSGTDRNPSEENSAGEIVPPGPEREVIPGRRSHKRKYFIVAGLSILLLVAGALYFGSTKPGQVRSGKAFPAYDIRDLKLSFEKQAASGTLLVVKGKVANVGNVPSAGIRIQATLLGKDNETLAEKAAFAGNLLDGTSLRRMDRAGIEGVMSIRFGEGNVNRNIPPGKALPFMVVFTDPPGNAESCMVRAFDAK